MDFDTFDRLRTEAKSREAEQRAQMAAEFERWAQEDKALRRQKAQEIEVKEAAERQQAKDCAAMILPRLVGRIANSPSDRGVVSWRELTNFFRYSWNCAALDQKRQVEPELQQQLADRWAARFRLKKFKQRDYTFEDMHDITHAFSAYDATWKIAK